MRLSMSVLTCAALAPTPQGEAAVLRNVIVSGGRSGVWAPKIEASLLKRAPEKAISGTASVWSECEFVCVRLCSCVIVCACAVVGRGRPLRSRCSVRVSASPELDVLNGGKQLCKLRYVQESSAVLTARSTSRKLFLYRNPERLSGDTPVVVEAAATLTYYYQADPDCLEAYLRQAEEARTIHRASYDQQIDVRVLKWSCCAHSPGVHALR